jgi:DNA invertase Pin-like site-specific DNA recombinase
MTMTTTTMTTTSTAPDATGAVDGRRSTDVRTDVRKDVRRVVIYCRTATDGSSGQRSLDQQAAELEAEAVSNGWTVVEWYDDLGQPDATFLSRPGLRAALGLLDAGRADALLVCGTARLSDNTRLLKVVFDLATAQGWQIVTPEPPPKDASSDDAEPTTPNQDRAVA